MQIALVDVADEAAMRALFAQIAAGHLPLKGVFHAAGVLDDAILLNQRWERFAAGAGPQGDRRLAVASTHRRRWT